MRQCKGAEGGSKLFFARLFFQHICRTCMCLLCERIYIGSAQTSRTFAQVAGRRSFWSDVRTAPQPSSVAMKRFVEGDVCLAAVNT